MPSVCSVSDAAAVSPLQDFAATISTCSDAFLERCGFLLRVHQPSPGAGYKISVRKPRIMASINRTMLNTSKIKRQYSFSTNSGYWAWGRRKRETSKLDKSNGESQYLHQQGAHASLSSFTTKRAPLPGLDPLPAFWAAEVGQAAPPPHVLHDNKPQPLGESSPPSSSTAGQYLPALSCAGHRRMLPPAPTWLSWPWHHQS